MILLLQEMIGSNDKSRWAFYSVALMRFAVAFLLRDFFFPPESYRPVLFLL